MAVRPSVRAEATAARLDGMTVPDGAGWVRSARQAALGRLQGLGLPQRRDEYWRFSDPTTLTAAAPPAAAPLAEDDGAFAGVDAVRVTFADGRFDPAASDQVPPAGVEVERLAVAAARDFHWSHASFGTLESDGHTPVPRPLAALNTAFAPDGLLIRVTGQASKPIHVVHRHEDPASDALLHHFVRVEPGASLTLLESGTAGARFNGVLEVELGEGASLHHVRVQGRDRERRAATHVFARLAANASFRSFTLAFNGRLTRNEAVVWMRGDDAVTHLAGAAVGDGDDFHHDDTVFVTHDGLRCESRQVFKKVLKGGAVGVFQGKILVKPGAQKTDGYQLSQALLLDEASQFLAKPELEIYADDVACSHGSTAGALDETALFYLRSRGVPAADARDLLTLAFLRGALEEVADEALAADLGGRLEGWLARRR